MVCVDNIKLHNTQYVHYYSNFRHTYIWHCRTESLRIYRKLPLPLPLLHSSVNFPFYSAPCLDKYRHQLSYLSISCCNSLLCGILCKFSLSFTSPFRTHSLSSIHFTCAELYRCSFTTCIGPGRSTISLL